ncbi:MAG: dihydroorotase [Cyanobacteria bacterium J06632_3]
MNGANATGSDASGSDTVGHGNIGDVLIENGEIAAIAPTLNTYPDNTEIIEAQGQYLGPGLIDLYSHSGEPGNESRETYLSLQQAATAGGFTRVGILPNTQPAIDNAGAIASVQRALQRSNSQQPLAQLMPWAAITIDTEGAQLTELAELSTAGALGFADASPLNNPVLLRRLLEYAQPLQTPIALWPNQPEIAAKGIAREGADALRLGLAGVSAIAETTALATLLEYIVEIPTRIHIMRVSTARSVELLRQAKSRNLPISASVPWHHLLYDTQDLDSYNPNLRHAPPLGTRADRQALIEGVVEGVIDAIAVDHSPYTYEEKTVAFESAPSGAIGLELALPALWQAFVSSGKWTPAQLWKSLSSQPAKCLNLIPGQLAVGAPAELTLFDPAHTWEVNANTLKSLSSNTPLQHGHELQGKVMRTWVPPNAPQHVT